MTTALLKLDVCVFSGYKIYPGRGKRYARVDGKVFNFLDSKTEASFLMRRNPRKICWTVLYRRKNKKGTQEETVKRRSRKSQKFQRAIQGATLENIMAKRNQKPEVRKAQREQLVRAAKEKNKAHEQKKQAAKASSRTQPKQKASKIVKSSAPRVGGRR